MPNNAKKKGAGPIARLTLFKADVKYVKSRIFVEFDL